MAQLIITNRNIPRVTLLDIQGVRGLEDINLPEDSRSAQLGTRVVSDVFLGHQDPGENFYLDYKQQQIEYDSILLQSVNVQASRAKNIVETSIQGRSGTIKEFISSDDYDITITGVLVGEQYQFPQEAFDALMSVTDAEAVIPIENDFLDSLGVTDIVIEDKRVNRRQGFPNVVDFEIKAISESEQDLVIIEEAEE